MVDRRFCTQPTNQTTHAGLDFQFPAEGSSTNDSLREQLGAYYKK